LAIKKIHFIFNHLLYSRFFQGILIHRRDAGGQKLFINWLRMKLKKPALMQAQLFKFQGDGIYDRMIGYVAGVFFEFLVNLRYRIKKKKKLTDIRF